MPSTARPQGHPRLVGDGAECRDGRGQVAEVLDQRVDVGVGHGQDPQLVARGGVIEPALVLGVLVVDDLLLGDGPGDRQLLIEVEDAEVALPLDVLALQVVLGRGQVDAVQVDEGVAHVDQLAELGVDLLDQGVEAGHAPCSGSWDRTPSGP